MDASPITPDLDEALRYAGVRADESGDMHRKMAEIAAQCMKTVTPRCTYRVSEIAWENGMPSLFSGQLVLPGRTAAVMLRSCSHAALLVCTLGTTFDALARQVQARDFADALLLDGFGGAYVEAGCNAAEREIAAKLPGKYLTDRFSPGYGDMPLSAQPGLLATLDAQRKQEDEELVREKKVQQAMLTIKKKFGKNAILKGMNLEEGATAKDRNAQIGGHKA